MRSNKANLRYVLIVLVIALVAAACGDDDAAADTTAAEAAGPAIQVAESDLGSILSDADGMTLYMFTPDNQGPSTCAGDCAETWPPLTGTVTAGDGVDAALIGAVDRDDGTSQVTYNGWPLYYFTPDTAPGDTNGQAANDVWFVISPEGEPIS